MSLIVEITRLPPEDGEGWRYCRSGSDTDLGILPAEVPGQIPELAEALPPGLRAEVHAAGERGARWRSHPTREGWVLDDRIPGPDFGEAMRQAGLRR